jgi:hypothetical protein
MRRIYDNSLGSPKLDQNIFSGVAIEKIDWFRRLVGSGRLDLGFSYRLDDGEVLAGWILVSATDWRMERRKADEHIVVFGL